MSSLFTRIFLSFWLAIVLIFAGLALLTTLTESLPLYHRWLTHSLGLYGRMGIDAYELGGTERLNEYLDGIDKDSHVHAALLKEGVVLGRHQAPAGDRQLLQALDHDQRSHFSYGAPWRGVVRIPHGGSVYVFAAEVRPLLYAQFFEPEKGAVRLLILIVISAAICGLLSRWLITPIRTLQRTASEIATGNLSARARPALAGRSDEIAQLAGDFDRMADRVQGLLDEQKILLRDISHELRSPLARLNVSAELVQRGDMNAAKRMQSDIQGVERMISDLLTLARLDVASQAARWEPVHVGNLVRQIVRDASFEGTTKELTVVQTGIADRYVQADAGLLHSCIENIVRNALKYTPNGGVVEVNLSDAWLGKKNALSVMVIDQGRGVPKEALQRIFDPFYRLPDQEVHRQGGTGLGLSISRRIAAQCGGIISAENMPDGGLAVTVVLPSGKSPSRLE